jgi:hypothetical protein
VTWSSGNVADVDVYQEALGGGALLAWVVGSPSIGLVVDAEV